MPRSKAFKVCSYNVHKCVGADGVFDPGRILRVLEEIDADIVALQEADMRFGARGGLLDLGALAERVGLHPVDIPVKRHQASHGWHGNLVLVRDGVSAVGHGVDLPGLEPRGALVVDIQSPEIDKLRVVATHLGLLRRSRRLQIHWLKILADGQDRRPTLIMGDLNEWRRGKGSSLRLLEPNFGPFHDYAASFPSVRPAWQLDRILARPIQIVRSIDVHDSPLARAASDHLPLTAKIDLAAIADEASLRKTPTHAVIEPAWSEEADNRWRARLR